VLKKNTENGLLSDNTSNVIAAQNVVTSRLIDKDFVDVHTIA